MCAARAATDKRCHTRMASMALTHIHIDPQGTGVRGPWLLALPAGASLRTFSPRFFSIISFSGRHGYHFHVQTGSIWEAESLPLMFGTFSHLLQRACLSLPWLSYLQGHLIQRQWAAENICSESKTLLSQSVKVAGGISLGEGVF